MATISNITPGSQCPTLTEQFTETVLELIGVQSELFWAKRRIQQLEETNSGLTQDLLRATERERIISESQRAVARAIAAMPSEGPKGPSLNLEIQQCPPDEAAEQEDAEEQERIWRE
jgi:hypothetical protein